MINLLAALFIHLWINSARPVISPVGDWPVVVRRETLAEHEISLSKRDKDTFVNRVFAENILLNLAYMRKTVVTGGSIDWTEVSKPFHWVLSLAPGKTVSYHALVLPKYQSAFPLTSLNFNASEGFLSDGWLVGDGVCHLASLIAWAARDAGLVVEAPTNHNFAPIPEVPKEQGVSIYSQPAAVGLSSLQNLYIQNNRAKTVQFVFHYQDEILKVSVVEVAGGVASIQNLGSQL